VVAPFTRDCERPVGRASDDRNGRRAGAQVEAAASRRMEQSAGALADGRLAAGLDETEQPPTRDAGRDARCSFDKRASSPAGSSRPPRTITGGLCQS
jgi:hypothetical protein